MRHIIYNLLLNNFSISCCLRGGEKWLKKLSFFFLRVYEIDYTSNTSKQVKWNICKVLILLRRIFLGEQWLYKDLYSHNIDNLYISDWETTGYRDLYIMTLSYGGGGQGWTMEMTNE